MADYTQEELKQIWSKGNQASPMNNDNTWRKDIYGSLMKWEDYGNRSSLYGWEVDHIIPRAEGGPHIMSNWQPLQWQNNLEKANGIRR